MHPTYVALNEMALQTGAWLNGVHRTCIEMAAFHMAPAMQHPKNATSTPLPWILIIRAIKGYSHSFRITCDMCAVSLLDSGEQHYIKAMNNSNTTTTTNNNNATQRRSSLDVLMSYLSLRWPLKR